MLIEKKAVLINFYNRHDPFHKKKALLMLHRVESGGCGANWFDYSTKLTKTQQNKKVQQLYNYDTSPFKLSSISFFIYTLYVKLWGKSRMRSFMRTYTHLERLHAHLILRVIFERPRGTSSWDWRNHHRCLRSRRKHLLPLNKYRRKVWNKFKKIQSLCIFVQII